MANYLIEVPHSENKEACFQAIQIFIESGNHFLANADWGCSDNKHKAWLIVHADTKEQATRIVPPRYRQSAKVTKLMKVTKEEVNHYKKKHELKETEKFHH